jgi:hypothetical protein
MEDPNEPLIDDSYFNKILNKIEYYTLRMLKMIG